MNNCINNGKLPHYSSSLMEKKHMEFFHVDFSHVDMTGKTTVASLTNFIQETAWQHASRVNIGYFDMLKQNTAFVINKMLLKIRRLPVWNEMISVETWLHPPENIHALREFTIRDNNRNLIAASSISYIAINTKTRRLSKFPLKVQECCMSDVFLDEQPAKIQIKEPHLFEKLHIVKPSDIDMNHHVNNARYIQWTFDNMPEKWYKNSRPASVCINFQNETHLNDEVTLFYTERSNRLLINGCIKKDNKTIFLAEIGFKNC